MPVPYTPLTIQRQQAADLNSIWNSLQARLARFLVEISPIWTIDRIRLVSSQPPAAILAADDAIYCQFADISPAPYASGEEPAGGGRAADVWRATVVLTLVSRFAGDDPSTQERGILEPQIGCGWWLMYVLNCLQYQPLWVDDDPDGMVLTTTPMYGATVPPLQQWQPPDWSTNLLQIAIVIPFTLLIEPCALYT